MKKKNLRKADQHGGGPHAAYYAPALANGSTMASQ